ncbi:MAG TPA: class I SAM-dependent methyltransferase [Ktedonobacteraceae bacterium]|nr:class I SAM-dependent methyltransferase [Ktedonobacteraceae bacterium]
MEKDNNTYLIDAESGAEMARLIDQDRIATKAMGSLLPPDFEPEDGKVILDLACGPGGWAQEVAFQYPSLQVIGIDFSHKMISYAQSLTAIQHLENLAFQRIDLRSLPLEFPDNTFDCINARFLGSFLFKKDWPRLIQECLRLLRPGGTLRFTESDRSARTTSPAFEELQNILLQHCYHTNRSFDQADMGVTIRLPQFLRHAACEQVQMQAHAVDWSIDASAWSVVRQNFETGYTLMRPHLVSSGTVTDEKWQMLWEQARREFYAPNFSAFWQFVSVWGQKAIGSTFSAL